MVEQEWRIGARPLTVGALALVAALTWSCATTVERAPDTDGEAEQAERVPLGMEAVDALDHPGGDQVDWKSIYLPDAGDAEVQVIVGDPFAGPHGLAGTIAVYPETGPPAVDEVAITPSEHTYTLAWESTGDATFLLQIASTSGAAPYRASFNFDAAPDDPCAEVTCDDGAICEEGECIATEPVDPTVCEPECGRNKICVDNVCEPYCGGGCKRGEYCHRGRNECRTHPCTGVSCPSGQKCVWGKCKAPEGSTTSDDSGGTDTSEPAPSPSSVDGRILSLLASGSNTSIVINRGRTHGVKRGMTGTITGVGSFTINEVYSFRSKALFKGEPSVIGTKRAVRIKLK